MDEEEKEKRAGRRIVRHVTHAVHALRKQCKKVRVFSLTVGYFVSQLHRFARLVRNVREEIVYDDETVKKIKEMLDEVAVFVANLEDGHWREFVVMQEPGYVPQKLREMASALNEDAKTLNLQEVPIVISGTEFDALILEDFMHLKTEFEHSNNKEFLKALDVAIEKLELESQEETSKFIIDLSKIQIQKSIGSGGFAEVFLGYNQENGMAVAVKMLRKQESDDLRMFEREVELLVRMKHFAVLPFVGACRDPMCIITQFMSGGSLYSKLHNRDTDASLLSPTQMSIIALGIAYGMSYIHSRHVIHRDLKSLNIMLDENDMPKICDFGMARMKTGDLMTMGIGTAQWMAPEVISGQEYNEKADVYSYGIILWEMLTGDIPFNGMNPVQVGLAVVRNKARPKIPKMYPGNLRNFIELCWDTDPSVRPDFPRIVGALETGAITFPGTDMAVFKDYVAHHSFESDIGREMSLSSGGWDMGLIATLQGRPGKVPENMNGITTEDELVSELLKQKSLSQTVLNILRGSDDERMLTDLFPLLAGFLADSNFRKAFVEHGGVSLLVHILLRFPQVLFVKLLDCLKIVTDSEYCIFERKHLLRLSCFFLCVDLTVRVKAIELVNTIFDRKLYEREDDFGVLIENLLRITIREARHDLLLAITNLYVKLLSVPEVVRRLKGLLGPETMCSLLLNENEDILDNALTILFPLISDPQVRTRTCHSFIQALNVLLPRITNNGDMVSKCYRLIELYFEDPNSLDQFLDDPSFFAVWAGALNCETARIAHLRISYGLCLREQSREGMKPLVPEFVKLMQDSNPKVSGLAAMNIAAFLSDERESLKLIRNNTLPIVKFLRAGITKESPTTAVALLFAGVLTKTPTCTQYIEEWDLEESIVLLLKSTNPVVVMNALKQIMAISAVRPETKGLSQAIDILFMLHESGKYGKYPLQCITNLSVMPENAVTAAKYAKTVLAILQSESDLLEDAVMILYRIVTAPESDKYLDQKDLLAEFVDVVAARYKANESPLFVSIIGNLTTIPSSRKIMKEKGVIEMVSQALKTTALTDPMRPELIKIKRYLSIS